MKNNLNINILKIQELVIISGTYQILENFKKTILVGKLITILPQQWKKFSMRISTDGIRNRILKKIHVIVEIKGGFGNQLFQFAFANSLRKMGYKVKVKLIFMNNLKVITTMKIQ